MIENPGVYPVTLSPEQSARADDLERRWREGDPTLSVFMLSELEAKYGVSTTERKGSDRD